MSELSRKEMDHLLEVNAMGFDAIRGMQKTCWHDQVRVPDSELGYHYLCIKCGFRSAFKRRFGYEM